ncbi:MAG: hypothetical protein JXA36_04900 [Coriobacteriia bacterium]|nr:hypothetical protein [Coriobacteriia bacterium]
MVKRLLIVGMVLALALGLVGCKSIQEKIGEEIGEEIVGAATDSDVEIDDEGVTIETEDGEVNVTGGDSGELPDGFPEDFPIYDGARIESSSSLTADGASTYYVNLISEDDFETVFPWYEAELPSAGWEITSNTQYSQDNGGGMLTVKQGETEGSVNVLGGDDGVEIGYIVIVE